MASMAALRQLQARDANDTQAQAGVELLNQGHHHSAHQQHLLMSYHQHHNRSHHMAGDLVDHYHTYQQHQQQQQQFISHFGAHASQMDAATLQYQHRQQHERSNETSGDNCAQQLYNGSANQHYQQYHQTAATDPLQTASMSSAYHYQQQQQQHQQTYQEQQYGQEAEAANYGYSAFLQSHQQQAGVAFHTQAAHDHRSEQYGNLMAANRHYATSTTGDHFEHDVKSADRERASASDDSARTRAQTNGDKSADNSSDFHTPPPASKRKAAKSKRHQSTKKSACSSPSPEHDELEVSKLKSGRHFDLAPEEPAEQRTYFAHNQTRLDEQSNGRDSLYSFEAAAEAYQAPGSTLNERELGPNELAFVDLSERTSGRYSRHADQPGRIDIATPQAQQSSESLSGSGEPQASTSGSANNSACEHNQLRILEMRKEKSRDAARSRRSKENHEFYELAKLLPLPAAITSQLDFLDKASIIRLTISFLKLRQFSVNGHPPWAPDFTTLGSVNPYSSQSLSNYAEHYASGGSRHSNSDIASPRATPNDSANYLSNSTNNTTNSNNKNNSLSLTPTPSLNAFQNTQQLAVGDRSGYGGHGPATLEEPSTMMIEKSILKSGAASLFDIHQGTHILQSLDGFAFAIGRDGRFLYISETVSMYLGLSQVEMTGSSVFDYTHQQDHEELATQLGIPYNKTQQDTGACCESPPPPGSVLSQYSAASSETLIEDHLNSHQAGSAAARKRPKASRVKLGAMSKKIKVEQTSEETKAAIKSGAESEAPPGAAKESAGIDGDPLVRQFCIRMKSTLTKRGCQHFKSSGYRVVHVVAHMRTYQSNDHGHLMDPLDECELSKIMNNQPSGKELAGGVQVKASKRRGPKIGANSVKSQESSTANCAATTTTTGGKSTESNNNNVEEEPDIDELKSSQQQKQKFLAGAEERRPGSKIIGMVAVAIALPPPSINELRLDSDTFVLRLGLDLRVSHIEPKITELLNYPLEMLAGKSLYSIVHPADVRQLQSCHAQLLKKGQMMSGYYRLLAQSGGYIWIQTCATLICNNNPVSLPGPSALASGGSAASSRGQSNSPMPMRATSGPGGAPALGAQQPNAAPPYGMRMPICGDINYGPWRASQASPGSSGAGAGAQPLATFEPDASQQVMLGEQQEQCVIFVNYMITDVVETDSILDVCQSQDGCQMVPPTPLARAQLVAGHQTSATQNSFNSPISSCASPATMKSLQPAFATGASTPSSVMDLASPQQQQQSVSVHQQQQQQRRAANGQHHHNSSQQRASKQGQRRGTNATSSSKGGGQQRQHHRHQSATNYSASLSDTNGSEASLSAYSNHNERLVYATNSNSFQQQQQQLQQSAHQTAYVPDTTTDGVALALRQQQQDQHHHQHHATFHQSSASTTATNLLESPGAAAAFAADYAAVDRSSIYKAATFAAGLAATEAVAAAGSYGTQQAAAGAYQQAAGYYHHAHQYHYHHAPHAAALHHSHNHTNQTAGGWQDSSTSAAAANSNVTAAAAAAASIPSYYNYHGYYGNRFI